MQAGAAPTTLTLLIMFILQARDCVMLRAAFILLLRSRFSLELPSSGETTYADITDRFVNKGACTADEMELAMIAASKVIDDFRLADDEPDGLPRYCHMFEKRVGTFSSVGLYCHGVLFLYGSFSLEVIAWLFYLCVVTPVSYLPLIYSPVRNCNCRSCCPRCSTSIVALKGFHYTIVTGVSFPVINAPFPPHRDPLC